MNELQLKMCDIQGRLFELSADKKYGSANFVKTFMTSEVAKALDSKYNRMQWAGEEYLLEELVDISEDKITNEGEVYSKNILYWMGYLYRYWHYYTGESSKEIYKQAPASVMNSMYLMYHSMSPEMAIDRLKETYKRKKKR